MTKKPGTKSVAVKTAAMRGTSVKFPADLRKSARKWAKEFGLSLNAFVRLAVSEKIRRSVVEFAAGDAEPETKSVQVSERAA